MECDKCGRPMKGSTAYDGACECGGLIKAQKKEHGGVLWNIGRGKDWTQELHALDVP